MSKLVELQTETWKDSPLMQSLIERDKQRAEKAIKKYKAKIKAQRLKKYA